MPAVSTPAHPAPPRLLVTAGPTHEPIDAVRYIANRSSGRLGIEIADHAASRGWHTTLLLGPTAREPSHTDVNLHRFQSAADLQRLLGQHFPICDILIMAAAVADYRPRTVAPTDKLRRTDAGLTLDLEPVPDLLAECARHRHPGQTLIGFALEPPDRLLASAREKLRRKGVDAIIANPLTTMDADTIEAVLVTAQGDTPAPAMNKHDFAAWLLGRIEGLRVRRPAE